MASDKIHAIKAHDEENPASSNPSLIRCQRRSAAPGESARQAAAPTSRRSLRELGGLTSCGFFEQIRFRRNELQAQSNEADQWLACSTEEGTLGLKLGRLEAMVKPAAMRTRFFTTNSPRVVSRSGFAPMNICSGIATKVQNVAVI